jgi:hypothetical protein
MKKRYFLIVGVVLLLCMGALLETQQSGWIALRTAVATDDITLTPATAGRTYNFTDKPVLAKHIDKIWNSVNVIFYGTETAADNETVNYIIYAWKADGPAKYLCSGVATVGTALTSTAATFWCDTITTVVNDNECSVDDSGNNRVAILCLGDLKGYEWVYCEFDMVTSNITAASCLMTGY